MLKGHPKGLLAAALSNMGERFGYYIMNAVLVLFLCSKFGLNDTTSALIYSCFYCGIYILSFFIENELNLLLIKIFKTL